MKEDIIHSDTVCLLRAAMKISSALNNLDELSDSNYNRFQFKKESIKWDYIISITLSNIMNSMAQENETLLIDVLEKISNTDDNIKLINHNEKGRNKKHLILFYSKIKSAINDIDEIQKLNESSFYPSVIKSCTQKLVSVIEGQHSFIMNESSVGIDIKSIVSFYDNEGKSIMYSSV